MRQVQYRIAAISRRNREQLKLDAALHGTALSPDEDDVPEVELNEEQEKAVEAAIRAAQARKRREMNVGQ